MPPPARASRRAGTERAGRDGDAHPRSGHQGLRPARRAPGARRRRGRHGDRGWRDRGPAGLVRLRQDLDAAHDRGLRGRHQRRDPARRSGDQPAGAGPAQRRDGVRGLCPLPALARARQHRLCPAARPPSARRGRGEGWRDRGPARDRGHPRSLSADHLGRPAAAHQPGPRADPQRRQLFARRADVAARAAAARDPARPHQGLADQPQDDDRVRHPRPDRGDSARRPHRGHGEGRARAARDAGRAEGAAGHPVRRLVHRRAADEHFPRAPGRARCHHSARRARRCRLRGRGSGGRRPARRRPEPLARRPPASHPPGRRPGCRARHRRLEPLAWRSEPSRHRGRPQSPDRRRAWRGRCADRQRDQGDAADRIAASVRRRDRARPVPRRRRGGASHDRAS